MQATLGDWLGLDAGKGVSVNDEHEEEAAKAKVVVVGGGYVGSLVARKLDRDPAVNVTLVDRNPCLVHKIAGLRAAVDVAWIEAVKMTRKNLLRRGSVLFGEVDEIDCEGQVVRLNSGETLSYDYLVIATGSCNVGPGEPPGKENTAVDIDSHYKHVAMEVMHANRIVVVGGGAVGIEFAGEVKSFYPEKQVTLIHSGSELIDKTGLNTGAYFKTLLQNQLEALDVEVIVGTKAEVSFDDFDESGLLPGERFIRTTSGREIMADLVVLCSGARPNNEAIPQSLLDQSGHVSVRETLQTKAFDNVFAVGDIANVNEAKMLVKGQFHVNVATTNIKSLVRGKEAKSSLEYSGSKFYNVIIVPVGPDAGSSMVACATFGSWLTTRVKSKSLFVDMLYPRYGNSVPRLP